MKEIVLLFEDGDTLPMFKSTKVNKKFLKCIRLINEEVIRENIDKRKSYPQEYFACVSCSTKPICPPCLIGCHQEHELKLEPAAPKDVFDFSKTTCNCYKSNCFVLQRDF